MVSDNHFRDIESCDNLVENEKSCSFPVSFKGGHFLYPFREIIYRDNDVFVPPSRNWVARHIIYPALSEGDHRYDRK